VAPVGDAATWTSTWRCLGTWVSWKCSTGKGDINLAGHGANLTVNMMLHSSFKWPTVLSVVMWTRKGLVDFSNNPTWNYSHGSWKIDMGSLKRDDSKGVITFPFQVFVAPHNLITFRNLGPSVNVSLMSGHQEIECAPLVHSILQILRPVNSSHVTLAVWHLKLLARFPALRLLFSHEAVFCV